VKTLVMVGAITRLNLWARFLIASGNALKHVIPFRVLYATLAWVIMPGARASEARMLFRREARQVSPPEFRRWLRLTAEIKNKLPYWSKSGGTRPVMYAMGGHDYMFLPSAQRLSDQYENVSISVISGSGHVCNVERPAEFNECAFAFIDGYLDRDTV
jgi:pimeloyl-ACP methyl ester carboxylesterase